MRINSIGMGIFFLSILLNGNLLIKDNYIFAGTDNDGDRRMPLSKITTWGVSSKIYGWTDTARFEPHTADPNDHREILVKVFYPSDSGTVNFANLGCLAPVILFSPGGGCIYDQYPFLINDLVKKGYVIVAVNHPYISGDCHFPDGHIVYYQNDQLSDAIRAPLQAGDFSFALDKVNELNTNDPDNIFTGKLDFTKIGGFGHSQGGMALSYAMVSESRIKAHIFHDGGATVVPYPENHFKFMNITAGNYSLQCDLFAQKLWYGVNEDAFSIRIPNGDHSSFFGSTASTFRTTVADCDLKFFDYCFKDSGLQDVLDLETTYPNNPFIYKPAYSLINNPSTIQWTQTNLRKQAVLSMHVRNNTFIAGTISGTMRSTDNGVTWTQNIQGVEPFWETTNPFCLASNSTYIFAGYYATVYRSADDGLTWTDLNLQVPAEFYTINAIVCQNSNVYAGTSFGFYRSANNGNTWTQITAGLNQNPNVTALLIHNTNLFAGTNNGVYVSNDNGLTWSHVGLHEKQVSSIVAGNNRIFAATFNEGIYYSDDNGANWTNLNFNTNNPIPVYSLMMYNNELYVASQGVHKYDSNLIYAGTCGLEDKYVCNLLVKGNYLFAGTNADGVWRIPLSDLTDISGNKPVPAEFNLSQNYPNPFNPSTVISYQLAVNSKVSLKIYNPLGQEVRALVNGYEAAGTRQVIWDGKDHRGQPVSSGVYLYRLECGGFTKTMKMMMLK